MSSYLPSFRVIPVGSASPPVGTTDQCPVPPQPPRHPRIIVFGNAKGGSGKSTAAMHVIVGLLREGCQVGAIDLDARQGTLTRYVDNRRHYAHRHGLALPHPRLQAVSRSALVDRDDAAAEECAQLARAIGEMADCDVIVIDTPGGDEHLSREALLHADLLVTPINDSFVDLDQLGLFDAAGRRFQAMGPYSELVWQQSKRRLRSGARPIEWLVMRNRVSTLDSRNGRNMDRALASLAQKLGPRLAGGFSERVIFRELFLDGLTLLDLREATGGGALTMSHLAARNEVRALLREIGGDLAGVDVVDSTAAVTDERRRRGRRRQPPHPCS